jgi:hypothetical protein
MGVALLNPAVKVTCPPMTSEPLAGSVFVVNTGMAANPVCQSAFVQTNATSSRQFVKRTFMDESDFGFP